MPRLNSVSTTILSEAELFVDEPLPLFRIIELPVEGSMEDDIVDCVGMILMKVVVMYLLFILILL